MATEPPIDEKHLCPFENCVKIFFATQTGSAERLSKLLQHKLRRFGVASEIQDLSTFSEESFVLVSRLSIFIVSTYGNGGPPDSARAFHSWLTPSHDESTTSSTWSGASSPSSPYASLHQLQYCVFGLGNSGYSTFCAHGRFLDRRLEELGARRLLPLGIGDDDGDVDSDFSRWMESFFDFMRSSLNLSSRPASLDQLCTFAVKIEANNSKSCDIDFASFQSSPPDDALLVPNSPKCNLFRVPVASVQQLRQLSADGSTLLIEFDLSSLQLPRFGFPRFATADDVGIHPCNPPELVNRLAKRLRLHLDFVLIAERVVKEDGRRPPFPARTCLRDALSWCVDLCAAPTPALLEVWSHFATDSNECAILQRISQSSHRDEFEAVVKSPHLNIVDALEKFSSVELSLDVLFEFVPPLQPRYFTIASSALLSPKRFSIVASMTQYSVPRGDDDGERLFNGCASAFLSSLRADQQHHVMLHFKPSVLRLPRHLDAPIIMICNGSGFAPFRGIIQDLSPSSTASPPSSSSASPSKSVLFFGCRHPDQDWICRPDMEAAVQHGVVAHLFTAFSRLHPDQRVYVQDRVREQGELVYRLLTVNQAIIMMCGSVVMGRGVQVAVQDIVSEFGHMESDEAARFVAELKSARRFVEELWSS